MSKYKKTVDKIEAGEELKQRILAAAAKNLQLTKNDEASDASNKKSQKRMTTLSNRGRQATRRLAFVTASLAAAVMISIVIGVVLYNYDIPIIKNPTDNTPTKQHSMLLQPIITYVPVSQDGEGILAPSDHERSEIIDWIARNGGNDFAAQPTNQASPSSSEITISQSGFIYTLNNEGLSISSEQSNGDSLQGGIINQIKYQSFQPEAMFASSSKLIVVISDSKSSENPKRTTRLLVYDLNNAEKPTFVTQYTIGGSFDGAKLGCDKLTLAVTSRVYSYQVDSYFPKINGEQIKWQSIRLYDTSDYNYAEGYNSRYTVLLSLDLYSLELRYSAHLGLSGQILFLGNEVYFFDSVLLSKPNSTYSTLIVKVSLTNLEYAASQIIDGRILDTSSITQTSTSTTIHSLDKDSLGNEITKTITLDKKLLLLQPAD